MNQIILGLILIFEVFAVAFNRGGGPLLAHIALTGVTFLVLCVCVFRRPPANGQDKINFKFSYAHFFYLFFLLLFLISFFWSLTPSYGLNEILLFANAGILLVVLSAIKFEEKDINLFAIFLMGLTVSVTLIGYFMYTGIAFPRFTATFIDLKESFRATGNDYANFVLLVLPFAFWQVLKRHDRITTVILAIFSAAILMSGFLLSFSRAAWFSFVGIISVFAIWFFIKRAEGINTASTSAPSSPPLRSPRIFATKLIAVIILTAFLTGGLQAVRSQKFETISIVKKLLFQADEGAASASNRLEFWRGAVQIIKDKPLFGGGVRSFRYLFPQYQKTFGIIEDHPHNIFLKIGVENGLPAVLLFAAFLAAAAILIFKFLSRHPFHPVLFLSLGALGAFSHNLLDFNFVASNNTLFMVFIGLSLSFACQGPSAIAKNRIRATWAVLLIVSILLSALALHEGYFNADFKRGRAELADGNFNQAILSLEEAQKLYFKRDLVNYLRFEKTQDFKWKQENTIDAEFFSRHSEFLEKENMPNEAENLASVALKLDPENNLKYYYQLNNVLKKEGKNSAPEYAWLKGKTLALLAEYKEILKNNAKLTILTENPQYASKLYELFGMKKEKTEIDKIWFGEIIKFAEKYGETKQLVPRGGDI